MKWFRQERQTDLPYDWEKECPELRLPKEGHVHRVSAYPYPRYRQVQTDEPAPTPDPQQSMPYTEPVSFP